MKFGSWDESIHTSPDQQKRIASAKKPGMTPLSVDVQSQSGAFAGSGKSPYETTLETCTCSDFIRRKIPCKHMYRLAIELGMTNESAENGMDRFTFSDTLDGLSDEAKQLLYSITWTTRSGEASCPVLLVRSSEADELVSKSLCVESIGDYTKATGTSPDGFRYAIDGSGIDFPQEFLGRGCRVKKMLEELQRLYVDRPDYVESKLIVLETSLQVSENVNTINRRYSKWLDG